LDAIASKQAAVEKEISFIFMESYKIYKNKKGTKW
jgi:hypothetical protein